ncbi:MAG: hypothetical protein KDB27_35895, partial [Planctomycetales bacterium]|nr:hypothetical protein [Planctomycetales bacterium]
MNAIREFDTDQLLQSAANGDDEAKELLLVRHRERLKKMIAIHLNPQLAARLDASDVVQDVLIVANQKLSEYLKETPIAFYPWLRKIAIGRLTDLYRHHVQIEKRSTHREVPSLSMLSDHSADQLVQRLVDNQDSPSQGFMLVELKKRLRKSLDTLPFTAQGDCTLSH